MTSLREEEKHRLSKRRIHAARTVEQIMSFRLPNAKSKIGTLGI